MLEIYYLWHLLYSRQTNICDVRKGNLSAAKRQEYFYKSSMSNNA